MAKNIPNLIVVRLLAALMAVLVERSNRQIKLLTLSHIKLT